MRGMNGKPFVCETVLDWDTPHNKTKGQSFRKHTSVEAGIRMLKKFLTGVSGWKSYLNDGSLKFRIVDMQSRSTLVVCDKSTGGVPVFAWQLPVQSEQESSHDANAPTQ